MSILAFSSLDGRDVTFHPCENGSHAAESNRTAPAPSCTRRVLPESSADDERAPIAARWDGPRKRALPGPTPGASQARPAAFLAGNQSVAAVLPMQPRSSTYFLVLRWRDGRVVEGARLLSE